MRRADREITDTNLIEAFIKQEKILRIAFYDNGDIYIVPVNYGYTCINDKYSFYFHGASAGRKYELAKTKPQVGFEIDGEFKLITGTIACEYSAKFQSVIGTGKLQLLENKEEKIAALNTIMNQVATQDKWQYDEHLLEVVAVFKLDADKISCKAK